MTPSAPSDAGTLPLATPPQGLAPGRMLGTRYRILGHLGRGGMGEVWLARDLKLQIDVALKSIRSERFPGDQGLELLRREVLAAREVLSPNVCRIFDLVEQDDREFISMEYIDGRTLLALLHERGPLDLPEATRIASQFLAGLEAIHEANLVHRDVKPENIMLTRAGRVVLMDFGVAKGIADGGQEAIAGTPAYMAPEQLRGGPLDARADIFAAGVVLAEMIAPGGVKEPYSRKSVWAMARQEPPRLFDSPWRAVLERAVAEDQERRYRSARQLARALEEVTLRAEGAESKRPYPGLEPFSEEDAEFFFGRELEVEESWKKLQQANLLAIIGPSGAGKSSFVRAGLIPAKPAHWRHIAFHPGSSPFSAIAQALASELAENPAAELESVQAERPEEILASVGRWRSRDAQVLIVVDQFEELFTLCRPEVRSAFADFLGRLAIEADVHVLLVMRDDFLFRCHDHPALSPVAADLTMLGPPVGGSLRRALVQPALLCGYRFEDEYLADEMLGAIEGEHGALPLLAFTAAQLWVHRDREQGILSREAYGRIGGVSGALAKHAEATLERIGSDRLPVVREVFRNLVTAQGTRAAAEIDEILSVFPDRDVAGSVLRQLVDARLLTLFTMPQVPGGGSDRHHVEIVHESLLTNWPRLVFWQAQDAEGALLRDQLRQQARLWEERERPEDLIWTGSSYREFLVWRERYPWPLSATEEAFARAMTTRVGRRRRRRRLALGAAFAVLLGVVLAVGWAWRAERAARLGAEADKLISLGRARLDDNPSVALAYGAAALDLVDNSANRRFALQALARGPLALLMPLDEIFATSLDFSPDGKRLAVGGYGGVQVFFADGSSPVTLEAKFITWARHPLFAPDGDRVVWRDAEDPSLLRVWSLSASRESRAFAMGTPVHHLATPGGESFALLGVGAPPRRGTDWEVWNWVFDDPDPTRVGRWDVAGILPSSTDPDRPARLGNTGIMPSYVAIDRTGRWVAYAKDLGVYLCPLEGLDSGRERLLGEHASKTSRVVFDPVGQRVASADTTGEIRIWSVPGDSRRPSRVFAVGKPVWELGFDPTGRILAVVCTLEKRIHLWDLKGPWGADPTVLWIPGSSTTPSEPLHLAFDPASRWIAAAYHDEIAFWPLRPPNPYVLPGTFGDLAPDRRLIITAGNEFRIQDLEGGAPRLLWKTNGVAPAGTAIDPLGRFMVQGTDGDGAYLISLSDGSAQRVPDPLPGGNVNVTAVSPDGQLVAWARWGETSGSIRVWDLRTDSVRVLEQSRSMIVQALAFSEHGSLFSGDVSGTILEWDLHDGGSVLIHKSTRPLIKGLAPTPRGHSLFASFWPTEIASPRATSELRLFDLRSHTSQLITTHGDRIGALALDRAGTMLVTSSFDGPVRGGPVTGGEPHLLFPREMPELGQVSTDGHWIAATSGHASRARVCLWRRPVGEPIHTLPHKQFLAHLRAQTNLQVVRDPSSETGYRVEAGPFPGWETVPTP